MMTEEEKEYHRLIDFSFFVANFNYTKADYDALTATEKAFIRKAWENKQVLQTSLINQAFVNAYGNLNRKKSKKWIRLWESKPKPTDKETQQDYLSTIEQMEKDQGKGWVELIYRASGKGVNHG